MDVLRRLLRHEWGGEGATLEDLYVGVEATAGDEWIDDTWCRHDANVYEWQHDGRWALLKLKKNGEVESPRRAFYRLAEQTSARTSRVDASTTVRRTVPGAGNVEGVRMASFTLGSLGHRSVRRKSCPGES